MPRDTVRVLIDPFFDPLIPPIHAALRDGFNIGARDRHLLKPMAVYSADGKNDGKIFHCNKGWKMNHGYS